MATVTVRTGGVGIDTSDFRGLAKALRAASPTLARGLRTRLRAAGEIVAVEARGIIGGVSPPTAASIRVSTSGLTVSVLAGGNGPIAGLLEMGSRRGGASSWRHPVFGNTDVWVDQPTHPYLSKAAANKSEELDVAVTEALDDTIRQIAFEG